MPTQDSGKALKFAEWRPIGVCDNGPPNIQKAKIFKHVDLETVTAPGVNRENWQEHPEVVKVIRKYGRDVAKISHLTKEMKRPSVVDIKLVGAVLQFNKTPSLNQESEDGKVQLFQVEFEDLGPKKRGRWWLIPVGLLFILCLGLFLLPGLNKPSDSSGKVPFCGTSRSSQTYLFHLKKSQQQHKQYLKQLPITSKLEKARRLCFSTDSSIAKRELRLVGCYLELRRVSGSSKNTLKIPFKELQYCPQNICKKELSHLRNLCRRL